MSSATLSKEFFELIKAIGESKSKQEEDRIIQDEMRVLKQLINDMKGGNKRMKEILVRLIYVEMLGHDASWGYVVAVQQTATTDLPQKRAGYLACSLMLSPEHEFRFMLVNQMQRDLGSPNVLEVCAALVATCKLVTTEMVPAVLPKVVELLNNDQSMIRKKAVMALHRFYQLDPGSIAHLIDQVKAMLRDRDPSVMGAALCVLHDLAKTDPSSQADLVDQYVSILKQITEHRLPRDFDYHRMPAPWIQIKLLQILATLGAHDKRASESMYEVVGECMKRADTGTNIGYAVVYEAVKTVTTIWPDTALLDAAANSISRFVQSEAYNLKYLGVTGLAAIVRDHPRYAVQHQMAIIDCLEDPDETLKRKTLELLFRMTNPANAEAVVEKLLSFLEQAVDVFLRADLVTRICQLADRYAPTNLWFVETMIRVFTIAGDLVSNEACQNLLRLLAEGCEPADDDEEEAERESASMRKRACTLFIDAVRKPNVSEVLMKSAFWTLGEYGFLLGTKLSGNGHSEVDDEDVLRVDEDEEDDEEDAIVMSLEDVLNIICDVVDRSAVQAETKVYGVSAIFKIAAQLDVVTPRAQQVIEKFAASNNTELQQRCKEFLFVQKENIKMNEVFPVDASCEDFENADFGFLDELTDILRAAGAPEYQEQFRIVNDYDVELGPVDRGPSPPAGRKENKLRFDAYEPPKLYETTISPAVLAAATPALSGGLSVDDVSNLVASASISSVPAAAQKSNVKAVWGPKGYAGSLPSLGGSMPQQVPSSPAPQVATPQASQATVPAVAPLPYQQPTYDYGEERVVEEPPPPPPPKKPEMTEKERAAMALFGGLGGSGGKSGSRSKSSSARAAPAAAYQPQTKKAPSAPLPDVLSSEGDLLGVELETATGSVGASYGGEIAPPPAPSLLTDNNLLDIFTTSSPSATSPAPAFAPSPPVVSKILSPRPMDTTQFGSLWPSHAAEARLTVRINGTFADFLRTFPDKTGGNLVEFIPATQEAIFAGDVAPSEAILIHSKDRGQGAVDLMIRSRNPAFSEKLAQFCYQTVF